MTSEDKETVLGSVYAHIGNGGVTFQVVDHGRFGPIVVVQSKSFGHVLGQLELAVTAKTLEALADLFVKAKDHKWEKEYCCAARLLEDDAKMCCGSDSCSEDDPNATGDVED